MHELNRRTEKVRQGAQLLVHRAVTQLLFLTNYNENVPLGRKAAGQKEAERIYPRHLLVSVWKSLKPSKMDRAGLLRFGTAEQKKTTHERLGDGSNTGWLTTGQVGCSTTSKQGFWFHQDVLLLRDGCSYLTEGQRGKTESEIAASFCQDVDKSPSYSVGGALLLEAAELELELVLVLGSSAIPPPSRNMVTAISRLLLHASNMCFPTLSVAPGSEGQGHKTRSESIPHV